MSALTLTPAASCPVGFCVNKNNLAGCAISQAIFKKSSCLKNLKSLSDGFDRLLIVAVNDIAVTAVLNAKKTLASDIEFVSFELAVLKSGCSERRGPTCGDTGRGAGTFPALATPPSNTGVDELLNSGASLK